MRWYLQFPISYRDLERMLADRGVQVDYTTVFRWIQAIVLRLGMSFHTAKFHVASIAAKLDATGRTDAVAQAVRLGLILL